MYTLNTYYFFLYTKYTSIKLEKSQTIKIHLFHKYLSLANYVPGTILGAGDLIEGKTEIWVLEELAL